MTSEKKLVKNALKHPELHTHAELAFFRRWLQIRKAEEKEKKSGKKDD